MAGDQQGAPKKLKLSDLASIGRWIFDTKDGKIDVGPVSITASERIGDLLKDHWRSDNDLAREMLLILGHRFMEGAERLGTGEKLTNEEVERLSEEDLRRFGVDFIAANIPATEGKSQPNSLREGLREIEARDRQAMEKLSETVRKISGWQFPSFSAAHDLQDSLARQIGIADEFRIETAPDYWRPRVELPENPLHETNARLEALENKLEILVRLGGQGMTTATAMQAVAAEFLMKFEAEAASNAASARKAIGVGILAIALTVIQIIYSEFWDGPRDSAETTAAVNLIETELRELQALEADLADELGQLQETVTTATSQQTSALNAAVSALQDISRSLSDAISVLLEASSEP